MIIARLSMQKVAKVASEHEEAKAFMEWLEVAKPPHWYMLFHVPNGGQRNVITAKKLQAEGVKVGVPDYFYPYPTPEYAGLFIELKRRKGGSVSQAQREYLDYLRAVGYAVIVAKGWEEAAAAVEDYLSGVLSMKGAA